MEAKALLSPFPSNLCFALLKSPNITHHYPIPSPNTAHLRRLCVLRASASPDNDGGGEQSNGGTPNAAAERHSSPTTLNIRYRSRRQQAKQQQQQLQKQQRPPPPAKKWEEMTVGEKAVEIYLGEKGILFWLNKLAYASIFVIIGGWILFRFVGPFLGLYQLDSPPLPPTSVFKDGNVS